MSVGLTFKMTKMKTRFLDRDSLAITPKLRRFFMRAGGAIRTTARRSLKRARKVRPSELNALDRQRYEQRMQLHRLAGAPKPVLPEAISRPGEPPRLHQKPKSLLKERLFFALAPDGASVVVGPEAIGKNSRLGREGGLTTLQELERRRPFMSPAFDIIEPRLPEYLAAATR